MSFAATSIFHSFGPEPGSTLVSISGSDETTLIFFTGASAFDFTTIVFGFISSSCFQKTKIGWMSSSVGMFAFKVNICCGCAVSSVDTVIVLCCMPVRLAMVKVAVISPDSPGGTSFDFNVATVQPHDVLTELMWIGFEPVFLYLKCATAF